MAFQPSIGDILMLSHTAWRIGKAFTKKGAPKEFAEVESEANGLSRALKLVAETLHENESILSAAGDQTKHGVTTILEAAQRSLEDLDSFVEQYQVIKKKQTNGGFVVERTWSDVVIANYKTIKWTTEGGDIQELRNILQMHTNTISLTMQALQSGSLARLEKTVVPMAEQVGNIHEQVNGDLGPKIDDLHRIIMNLAKGTPSLVAIDAHRRLTSAVSSVHSIPSIEGQNRTGQKLLEAPPVRIPNFASPAQLRSRRESAQGAIVALSPSVRSSEVRHSVVATNGMEDSAYFSVHAERPPTNQELSKAVDWSPAIPERSSQRESARRESSTLGNMPARTDAVVGSSDDRTLLRTGTMSSSGSDYDEPSQLISQPFLPPHAVPPRIGKQLPPATPASVLSSTRSVNPRSPPSQNPNVEVDPTSPTIASPSFEKSLFRNSVTLCDVRATLVEYTQPVPDETDPRYTTELVEATQACRVCVIRKREDREHGGTRLVTSIWALSNDCKVRMQQKLPDEETVPFCSYFQPEKASLDIKDTQLKFHADAWAAPTEKEVKTSWVNYVFETPEEASSFQSALFGRNLIANFKTIKTTIIHNGLKGTFAYEKQMSGIEMLRVWEDDGVYTPGAAGGVLALLHLSANFGEGWARWWVNSSKQQTRFKDDGGKFTKVKGLDISVEKPGAGVGAADRKRSTSTAGESLQRRESETRPKKARDKNVTGVRIEFVSEEEKRVFLVLAKKAQERMLPLPELR